MCHTHIYSRIRFDSLPSLDAIPHSIGSAPSLGFVQTGILGQDSDHLELFRNKLLFKLPFLIYNSYKIYRDATVEGDLHCGVDVILHRLFKVREFDQAERS
jgi:hypothetical protein